jgi:hypothetical protein
MSIPQAFASSLTTLLLATTLSVTAQENLADWSQNKTVSVNTRASGNGAGVAGNVLNYPLLVRLDSGNAADIFAGTLAGGLDIRFSKTSGGRLAFQRERWDAAAKKAEFWVLLDTVRGNDSTALRIHWGKSGAPDSSKGSAVFSAANGYLAVWHLNETLSASGDSIANATGPNHKAAVGLTAGTGVTVPANTAALGVGKNFAGEFSAGTINTTGAFLLVNNQGSALDLNTSTGPFTISAWANPAVCDNTTRIALVTKYGDVNTAPEGARAWALQTGNADGWRLTVNPLAFSEASTTAAAIEYVTNTTCTENQWTYLAGSYNSNGTPPTMDAAGAQNNKLYRNGASGDALVTGVTGTQQPVSLGNSSDVYIGRIAFGGTGGVRYFRGGMDEIRLSNVERAADWNKLDYETQRPGATSVAVGGKPATAIARASLADAAEVSIFSTGAAVRFRLPAGSTGARITVTDFAGRGIWSGNVSEGTREFLWNGIAASGQRAVPGGYIARIVLRGSGETRTAKILLMR